MYRTKPMKLAGLLLLIMQGAAVGCGDDGAGPVEEQSSPLYGVWDATQWEVKDAADPGNPFDFVLMGFSYTLKITADDRFAATFGLDGELLPEVHGDVKINGDRITLDPDAPDVESMEYRYSISGAKLTLTRTAPQDIDGDGVDELVEETLVFQRR